MRRLVLLTVTAAMVLSVAACGRGNPEVEAAEARTVSVLDLPAAPGELNGLAVVKEDISKTVEDARRPYFDATVLYSLRQEDRLQATLQVGRYAEGTRYADSDFRRAFLNTVGGSPKQLRMGDDRVWLTTGDRQAISIWFRDRHVFILSAREEYQFPRTLLRSALEIQP
jgi:hypothetical protein